MIPLTRKQLGLRLAVPALFVTAAMPLLMATKANTPELAAKIISEAEVLRPSEIDVAGVSVSAPPPVVLTSLEVPLQRQASGPIDRLFLALFGRMPDPEGKAHWQSQHEQGTPLEEIASQLLASPEYTSANPADTNIAFVDILYSQVLRRPAETTGADHWVELLNEGTSRAWVATQFSESDEFKQQTSTDQSE